MIKHKTMEERMWNLRPLHCHSLPFSWWARPHWTWFALRFSWGTWSRPETWPASLACRCRSDASCRAANMDTIYFRILVFVDIIKNLRYVVHFLEDPWKAMLQFWMKAVIDVDGCKSQAFILPKCLPTQNNNSLQLKPWKALDLFWAQLKNEPILTDGPSTQNTVT